MTIRHLGPPPVRRERRKAGRPLFMNEGMKKRIIITVISLLAIVFGNGCYYVFRGQIKSMAKLERGAELNLYEKCSIYTMHIALWSLGWPMSPQAARECFMLHFPQKDTVFIDMHLNSPRIESAVASLKKRPVGSSVRVAWNGADAYSLASPEHKAAIAVNPCRVVKEWQESYMYTCSVYSLMQYPRKSNTVFTLGSIRIPVQEGLFRYLQDKGWLSCFTARYQVGNNAESLAIMNRYIEDHLNER